MKNRILFILATWFAIASAICQTPTRNVTDTPTAATTGTRSWPTTETVPTAFGQTFNSGSTITINGAFAGTPTGGTLDLSNLTLTLPASAALPSQGGNSGKFLTTNGSAASWSSSLVTALAGTTGQINVSGSTGSVTLTLPQSSVTSMTKFANLTFENTSSSTGLAPGIVLNKSASASQVLGRVQFLRDPGGDTAWSGLDISINANYDAVGNSTKDDASKAQNTLHLENNYNASGTRTDELNWTAAGRRVFYCWVHDPTPTEANFQILAPTAITMTAGVETSTLVPLGIYDARNRPTTLVLENDNTTASATRRSQITMAAGDNSVSWLLNTDRTEAGVNNFQIVNGLTSTNVLHISSANKVGILNTSPSATLDVTGSGAFSGALTAASYNGNTLATGTDTIVMRTTTDTLTNKTLTDPVIARIVPNADFKLYQNSVNVITSETGSATVDTIYLSQGTVGINGKVSNSAAFAVAKGGATRFYIGGAADNDVHIAANSNLTVENGTFAVKDGTRQIFFDHNTSRLGISTPCGLIEAGDANGIVINANSSGPIVLGTGGAEAMRVTSAGKVGIGPAASATAIKNIRHGTSGAMTAGVVTVTDTGCTANTRYFFTVHTIGTITLPASYYASTRTASTSFVITSSQITDTSTVDWLAIEP